MGKCTHVAQILALHSVSSVTVTTLLLVSITPYNVNVDRVESLL